MKMVETIGGVKCFPGGWTVPAKVCGSCKTAVALLFCRKDTMFLCLACDLKLHSHTRHERVWMCEVCEQAPASVTCKADAAALCVTCDRDIHSANPLSRRHDRVPVVPFYDCAEFVKSSVPCTFLEPSTGTGTGTEDLTSSITNDDINWGIPAETINIDVKYDTSPEDIKSIDVLFPEPDLLLDFDFPVPTDAKLHNHSQFNNSVNDSVVPFQLSPPAKQFPSPKIVQPCGTEKCYEIDFTRSNIINSYNKNSYLTQSLNHSGSSSSMDAGIVPDGKSASEMSNPFVLQMNEGSEMNGITISTQQQPTQLSGVDREARVMRYREKRKNRKFEKTIRYASRKAYAETRPRIKGRFAKRTESVEADVDRWLFTAATGIAAKNDYGVEVEYGVVPSYCREVV
uniref:Zinc finger protein CONSTANS-LIKe 5 protein n=1 Tax=Ambrosia artemisiifolia TaxID=4212 RepID=A0A4P8PIM1_AMBAR|nr:zinc finger protein CONSTANS-LIKe 5 protein [Ambrosia artemisiifolia]